MSFFNSSKISFDDAASMDAFNRLRVSQQRTLFDSKQLYDKLPLFWSEVTSGAGETSVHNVENASTLMSVAANSGEYVIRQTKMRFNYEPGKSHLIMLTGEMSIETNVVKRLGYFTGQTISPYNFTDGLFFSAQDGYVAVNQAKVGKLITVEQSNWNLDTLDGTGSSGKTLNMNAAQIFIIDFEWLGTGRVRMGFVIDGLITYCHQFLNANALNAVYMSTPNLPVRYEIRSTGGAGSLEHICSTVQSEGGWEAIGSLRVHGNGSTHIDANTADVIYAVAGIRLKATHLGAVIMPISIDTLSETADNYLWRLSYNPTIAGTFTYSDLTNSAVQTATGATENTISDVGTVIARGYGATGTRAVNIRLEQGLRLGAQVNGTRDTLVLSIMPFGANADVHGTIQWRELL